MATPAMMAVANFFMISSLRPRGRDDCMFAILTGMEALFFEPRKK
jgi:hypothetical protein